MNADVEFLNYVYQNSQMGIDTLEQLLEITDVYKRQVINFSSSGQNILTLRRTFMHSFLRIRTK